MTNIQLFFHFTHIETFTTNFYLSFLAEGEDSVRVDARLESLLKYVQSELMRYCDCSVDALDDAFLWDIVETCEEHFGISRFFAPDNWSFDDEKAEKPKQRPTGSEYLIQSMNDRDLFRKRAGSNASIESIDSEASVS